jgi:flagellar P-ring protein precursor FlgI
MAATLVVLTLAGAARGQARIKDITRLKGEQTHTVVGYGLVVGLAGTGDSADFLPAIDALRSSLTRFSGAYADPTLVPQIKKAGNVAIVHVTATLPAYHSSGDMIDVKVASKGTAKSLRGGLLMTTPLQSSRLSDDSVYAVAGGSVTITDGNPTTGFIAKGAKVVQSVDTQVLEADAFTLLLRREKADFTTAAMIAQRINAEYRREVQVLSASRTLPTMPAEIAHVLNAEGVHVRVPSYYNGHPYEFIARVGRLEIGRPDKQARVVIDERAGTIVADLNVHVSPAVTSHKGLTLVITETRAGGDLTLNEVLAALKTTGLEYTSQDLIEIVKMLNTLGAIHGEVTFR